MRLIDIEAPCKIEIELDGEKCHATVTAPTVDAVPVVRCKDCKWWKTNYSWNGKEHKVCVIEPYEPVRKPEDYCSRGERKDDDNERKDPIVLQGH